VEKDTVTFFKWKGKIFKRLGLSESYIEDLDFWDRAFVSGLTVEEAAKTFLAKKEQR
jgi:hypothetical protein